MLLESRSGEHDLGTSKIWTTGKGVGKDEDKKEARVSEQRREMKEMQIDMKADLE